MKSLKLSPEKKSETTYFYIPARWSHPLSNKKKEKKKQETAEQVSG